MKIEEVKQITNRAFEELTGYLKTMSLFSKYSSSNLFLIARQRPDARRVAGYQAWRTWRLSFRRGGSDDVRCTKEGDTHSSIPAVFRPPYPVSPAYAVICGR
jgi:hypothetical protein